MIRKRDGHRSLRAGVVATLGAIAVAVLAAGCDEMVKPAEDAPAAPAAATPAPAAATPTATGSTVVPDVIPFTAPINADRGFAWIVNVPVSPDVKKLRVFEDGKELGPGEALHATIRDTGLGAYSHWKGTNTFVIYFSTSDNSDPNTNGRTYEAK
jgi:pectate lyase